MRVILRPQWLMDGTGAAPLENYAVVIDPPLIHSVVPAADVSLQEGDQVIEMPHSTLLPGLVNNHVHLVLPGDNTPFVPWIDTQSDAALALLAAHNARKSLGAGVTTVRDCGGRRNVVLDVRNAQAAGQFTGARIVSCGWTLTITGGHTRHFGGQVDGRDGLVQMVRQVVGSGADYVKVMASGGGTPGSYSEYPSFTVDELCTIVEISHMFERKVSAHCTNGIATRNAVAAGVDLIEHAMFITPDGTSRFEPEVARRIADAGIPVTPTLQVDRDMLDRLPPGAERELWRQHREEHHAGVAAMHDMGITLLAGSDAGWRATAFDEFWKELDELVACGLSPVEAVHAATGAVADALGYSERWGTIQPGLVADVIAVRGNLAEDITRLRDVYFVAQEGAIHSFATNGG